MSNLLHDAPYYDRYDKEKQYTQLLAVPGRVAQAREITEIQSTLKDIIKSLGDSMMNDGNIVEGCQVIPNKTESTVTITPGKIYMKGLILPLKGNDEYNNTTLTMTAIGKEIIGVSLVESIVSYHGESTDDLDLLDPAIGYYNYQQTGCDRLKSELSVAVYKEGEVPDSVAVLATLINGELSVEQQSPNYDKMTETLARRTYDESGSYIVNGLEVSVKNHIPITGESGDSAENPENYFDVVVSSGKAYVRGYELSIPSDRTITVRRSISKKLTEDVFPVVSGQAEYLISTGLYVESLQTLKGSFTSEEEPANLIAATNSYSLSYSGAYYIREVKSEDRSTTYDSTYWQRSGNNLVWKNNSAPAKILVTYDYKTTLVPDTDYESAPESIDGSHYFKLLGTVKNRLVVPSELTLTYNKWQARKDTVYMDQYGDISVLLGNPDEYGFEIAPKAPEFTLPLASISSPPGGEISPEYDSSKIDFSNVGLTRFTMQDIHKIVNRIRTMEYDQTVLSLNTEARDYTAGTNKKGIFTDPFIDLSKIDLYFNLNLVGERRYEDRPKFDTTIDLGGNMVYLPLISQLADLSYSETDTRNKVHRYDKVVTLDTVGEPREVLSQLKATTTASIAPYVSAAQAAEIFLDPSLDTWYDDNIITVPVSINQSKVVSESTRHIKKSTGSGSQSTKSTKTTTKLSTVGTTVETLVEEDVISESAVTYIRQRSVTVTGNNFQPNVNNITCYFEGEKVSLSPAVGTQVGSTSGTVKADNKGSFKATFTIPSGMLTGTRTVTVEVPVKSADWDDSYKNSAFAFYKATGTARTIQQTITTVTTVLQERVTTKKTTTTYYDPDPLAQTFILDEMTLLCGIDVYFESVPTNANVPVTCEIREVSNGNITNTILGFKTLMSYDILAGLHYPGPEGETVFIDPDKGTKATRFSFNDPVLIEANKEYAFVLKSSAKDYRAWIAEIGETDIASGQTVLMNPYLLGVMMSSSNGSSWTTHQKSDIKFRLLADNYSDETCSIYFEKLSLEEFCRFTLAAESLVFNNTSIDWSYSLNEGESDAVPYTPIEPYNFKTLNKSYNSISLRANLNKNANTTLTPILSLDSVSLSAERYDYNDEEGRQFYYISNLITGLEDYNQVDIILDTYTPSSGVSLKVYVSTDLDNAATYHMYAADNPSLSVDKYGAHPNNQPISSTPMSNGWVENTYRVNLSNIANNCRIFVEFRSDNNYTTPAIRRLRAIMHERIGS